MYKLRQKTLLLAMTSVLVIFTIGLPVIVASCPMARAPGRASCSACLPPGDGNASSISAERNTSCCRTIIASGRNLTEFLTVGNSEGVRFFQIAIFTQVPHSGFQTIPVASPGINVFLSYPPPTPDDIPVLVSSLLI